MQIISKMSFGDNENNIFPQAEPLFVIKPTSITSDMLEDWLFILAEENSEKMQSKIGNGGGQFKHGAVAEVILRLCLLLQQPYEVKYHAIELFDLFMTKHVDSLRRHIESNVERGRRACEWQMVLERVKTQLLLRVMSCIQIASKLYCHNKSVSVTEIISILQRFGHPFRRKSVLHSELRVLNVVDYHVNLTTPLVYVEALLETLGRNDGSVNVKPLYNVALDVLDVSYVQREDIYLKLFNRITGKRCIELDDLQKLNLVKADALFMATAVIACSAYILQQGPLVGVVEQMHFITGIPNEEIMELTIVLVGEILQQDETPI